MVLEFSSFLACRQISFTSLKTLLLFTITFDIL